MNRDITNSIRFFLDEFLPPFLRKNRYFMYPLFYIWYKGKNVTRLMEFKERIAMMTDDEYTSYYLMYDSLAKRETDLNRASITFILKHAGADKDIRILDVGCGNGYMLKELQNAGYSNLSGCDIIRKVNDPAIAFFEANIEALPFNDKAFDIVICSHTLEHAIHLDLAAKELKRIAKKKLIVTVPCQVYNRYTFDLHVNFFPTLFDLQRCIGIERNESLFNQGDWSYAGLMDK